MSNIARLVITTAIPGIIIHDSPREADLGPLAYQHYLSSIHTTFDSLACEIGIPIQYIVTTTTPPPKYLRRKSHTPLRLGGKDGMLFGKPLKTARPRQTEFPEPEKSGNSKFIGRKSGINTAFGKTAESP